MSTQINLNPIGVIDSGIGGLSVFRQLTKQIANEQWIYLADTNYNPYGDKSTSFIQHRCSDLVRFLLAKHQIKMLIVACNTATAVAISHLRDQFPQLPIIGLEPAIKPAMQLSTTKHILTLATNRTVNSQKFQSLVKLVEQQSGGTINYIACTGLADAIEKYLADDISDKSQAELKLITKLLNKYLDRTNLPANWVNNYDVLVLGCTHYPLVKPLFEQRLDANIICLDSAQFIVKRCRQLLHQLDLQGKGKTSHSYLFYTSHNSLKLKTAIKHILDLNLTTEQCITLDKLN